MVQRPEVQLIISLVVYTDPRLSVDSSVLNLSTNYPYLYELYVIKIHLSMYALYQRLI